MKSSWSVMLIGLLYFTQVVTKDKEGGLIAECSVLERKLARFEAELNAYSMDLEIYRNSSSKEQLNRAAKWSKVSLSEMHSNWNAIESLYSSLACSSAKHADSSELDTKMSALRKTYLRVRNHYQAFKNVLTVFQNTAQLGLN